MGNWGSDLFTDDLACDVRETYLTYLDDGVTNEEATSLTIEDFVLDLENNEDELAIFWISLAATQLEKGYLQKDIKEKAVFYLEKDSDELFIEHKTQMKNVKKLLLKE